MPRSPRRLRTSASLWCVPALIAAMAEALLALGGNVGEVRDTLDRAVAQLCDGDDIKLTARSSHYLTPPWGVRDQPPFVNLCIGVQTKLTPRALLARAQTVESA